MSRFFKSIALVTLAAAIPLHAQVQVQLQGQPAVNGDQPTVRNSKDTPTGVSVPDSPGAAEDLAKAHDKEQQKQWKTAAEFYQEALAKYSARVVPVKVDKEAGTYQYVGVTTRIQQSIAQWPAEGLAIYRNLYGHTADDLLASARRGDVGMLREVFSNYFVTDAGKTAGIRLIDSYLESGDFSAAAWVGDRLLTLHPSLGGDWGMVLYRTAVAWHWSGNDKNALALLDQLKQKSPNEAGSVGGKDVSLADVLTMLISTPLPAAINRVTDADNWPQFNGVDGRGDISPSTARPGASRTRVVMSQPVWTGIGGDMQKQLEGADKAAVSNFRTLGVMPVVDAGSLFFQDGRSLYAINPVLGIALPGWLNTYSEHGGHYKFNVSGRPTNEELTVTVTSSAVLAVMGQADHTNPMNPNAGGFGGGPFIGQNGGASTVKLVCLDRETGRELWTRSPSELPESLAALRTGDYVGTPLVIPANIAGHHQVAGSSPNGPPEDSVLVVARGGKDQQFDDCYLISLSMRTGQFQWSTYLGSGTRSFENDGTGEVDPSQMAFADGRVFVMTNLGSVAAVDPSDGRVIWLSGYERDGVENLAGQMWRGRRFRQVDGSATTTDIKAWEHNPVFVNNGHVFIMPNDARKLNVYDAGNGLLLQSINTSDYGNASVLLGIRNAVRKGVTTEVAVLTSQQGLIAVDWQKYNHDDAAAHQTDPDSHTDKALWAEELLNLSDTTDPTTICGRGFLTADSIFIPTRDRLFRVQWPAMKIASFYPADGVFSDGQGPGNVLVTAENVVVAGATQLDVYTDLDTVRKRYQQDIAAAPNDPKPRVGFAMVLDSGGHSDEALAQVDDAINLAGGLHSMHSGENRAMIFSTLLGFADRTATSSSKNPEHKDARLAFAGQLFDRAAAAADSPQDQATYRLTRARADHQIHDYASEVKLCQEILSDETLRSVVVGDGTAADTAEAEIAVAIDLDRSVYRPIEALAKDAWEKALAANDAEQLLAVGVVYPNSHAATEARQAAVDRFEAAHEPARAIDILRLMYATAGDPVVKAQRLQQIANDFLSQHEVGAAIDRLARAARLSPDPMMNARLDLPDGKTLQHITYAAAVNALRELQSDEASARLPDFKLAAPPGSKSPDVPFAAGRMIIPGILAVAHPLQDFNRNDQILAASAAGLSIFPVGQTTPLATLAEIKDPPQGAAWTHDKWYVWTPSDLFQIGGDGKLGWSVALNKLPTLPVSSGDAVIDEQPDENSNQGMNNINGINARAFVNGQVRFARLNGQVQRVLAPANVPAVPPGTEPGTIEQVVAVQPAGSVMVVSTSVGRILGVNGGSGQILWQTRVADHAVDQLLANAHFTVVRADDPGGSMITVFDSRTGRLIGRRKFGADNTPTQLVNVALSEEATLAYTLLNRVLVKDLYEPWKAVPSDLVARANQDIARFGGLNQNDQLVISGGRLVCLYDSGRYCRAFDLTGAVEPTLPLNTLSNSPAVWLQMVGSRLFAVRTTGMKQYNLADAADHDSDAFAGDSEYPPNIHFMLLGKDYAVLLDERSDRGPAGSPAVRMLAYSRAKVPGKNIESGRLDFEPTVNSATGITDWLAADGGFYYLSKDGKLHFLAGGRP